MAERASLSRTGHLSWAGIVFFSALSIVLVLLCWSAYGIRNQHRELTLVEQAGTLVVVDALARAVECSLAPGSVIADRCTSKSRAQLVECFSRARAFGAPRVDAPELRKAMRERGRTGVAKLFRTLTRARVVTFAVLLDADGTVIATAGRPGVGDDGTHTVQRAVIVAPDHVGTLRIGIPQEERFASQDRGLHRSLATSLVLVVLTSIMVTVVLIRQRVLIREATRERSLTEAVLTGMRDGVVVLDSKGRVRMANPAACRLFDTSSTQFVGKDCQETPCAGLVCGFASTSTVQEAEIRKVEGSSTPVRAVVAPLRDTHQHMLGRAVILSDLTDACRFEREQRRTRSLVAFGRFASMVAHEIRNPLNAIAVGVQRLALETSPSHDPDAERLIALVREEVERLDRILGNFLDLSRPPRLEPSMGDLDAVIDETMTLLQGAPPGILITHSRNGGCNAVFDPQALRQVLLNLVHNAIEALGDRGRVEIAARREERSATLEVRDNGPGIPDENREQVFEFGFTTKPAGHGLGLPIVHRLVVEMHGSLEVDSVLGEGTTIRVRLPVADGVEVA
jgi:signal transduction histidine kinase